MSRNNYNRYKMLILKTFKKQIYLIAPYIIINNKHWSFKKKNPDTLRN